MSVANQKIIKIENREAFDKNHLFCRIHLDAMQEAMNNIKGEALKLWLYLVKNQNNFQLELSQKALEEWGLKKDAYYKAVDKLIELKYLTPIKDGSNIYTFSEKPKDFSENQKNFSEKPQRNTTYTTNTTISIDEEVKEDDISVITIEEVLEYYNPDEYTIDENKILTFAASSANSGKKFRVE